MRFHKAESAFFVFMTLILLAGLMLFHAYSVLQDAGLDGLGADSEPVSYLGKVHFGVEVLLATAVFFGSSSSIRSFAARFSRSASCAP